MEEKIDNLKIVNSNSCVVCGDEIPEGRQVCSRCEVLITLSLKKKKEERNEEHN